MAPRPVASRPGVAFPALVFLLAAIGACAGAQGTSGGARDAGPWTDLLASPATQWRGYQKDALPDGWRFDDATKVLTRVAGGGDIVTRAQYGDFEFELEWRVGPRGNSGIFFHATEATARIYENATEMQILDNAGHPDGRNSATSAGANYGLYAPPSDVTRPVGEWNHARIVAVGDRVEHWLNGVKVVEYTMGSADWTARVAASKFAQWPSYGLARRGHIGLQDHGDVVSFRLIRVRELTR